MTTGRCSMVNVVSSALVPTPSTEFADQTRVKVCVRVVSASGALCSPATGLPAQGFDST